MKVPVLQVNTSSSPLAAKPHFEILDGLRGVAALAVVVFHFMEVAITDSSKNFIGHGFLAVDFFFCLSGFVIAYAYDNRLGQMRLSGFFKARLIRLHPLIVLGAVLGLIAFLFDPFGGHPEVYSAGRVALLWLCTVLLIPFPVMPDRAFNLFGLNAPAWSLFWEYIANIVYALLLYRLGRRWLALLLLPAAAGICVVTYRSGSIVGGWGGSTFWDGGVRVAYSFIAGMLVYRYKLIVHTKLNFTALAVMLCMAFLMPFSTWNWLTEPLVVIIYFPLLVALGAGASVGPRAKKLCNLSGNLSYPLYMTHYAVIWMFANYYSSYKPGNGQLTIIVISGVVLLTVFAYLVMIIYDVPVRRYLNLQSRAKRSIS